MRLPLALFVSLPTLLAAAAAQEGIRIRTVPERVQLPAARGSNLLLEVEVDGLPDAVWLATDAAAQDRVPLVASGDHRFQTNLADAAVAELLPAGRDQGSLFVFARHGARTAQSAAIAWSRATTADGKVRCLLRSKGGSSRHATPDQRVWVSTESLERIELQGAGARQSAAIVRIGDFDQPLVRRADAGLWVLDVDAALRERLQAASAFEIEVRQGAASTLFGGRCVPTKLAPGFADAFTVQQRKRAFVPGSGDWLEVRIDDITMGRVMFELVDAEGRTVVGSRFVRERDHVEFTLGKERYVLVVRTLHNALIGEDHAEFAVQPAAGFRPDPIAQLLHAVEASGDTFVREGKDFTGAQAAQFLVAKLANHQGPAPSVDEFTDTLASQSSKTGVPYQVKRANGDVVTMREWLRAERAKLDAANDPARR